MDGSTSRERLGKRCLPAGGTALLATLFFAILLVFAHEPNLAWADEAGASTQSSESAQGENASSDKPESAENAADKDADVGDENLVDPTQRADNSFIYDTTIDSLFDQASIYENSTVQVVGEVIGDLITANGESGREMYWIMLTSTDTENKASISVLLSAEQAKQIDHFGRYGVVGTTLQVRGIFHQACEEHQGLPDIHATTCSPLARGSEHPDSFRIKDFIPGGLAVLLGVVLMGVYYFARERSR